MDLNDILMDEESLQKSRANRLKRLRRMTGMSRKDFSTRYHISQGTLQNWETGRFGGLTEKGARVILRAFRQEKYIVVLSGLCMEWVKIPSFTKR